MSFGWPVWCTPGIASNLSATLRILRQNDTHVHASPSRNRQRSPRTPLHLSRPASRRPLPHRALPIPAIPDLHRPILARRRHVPSPGARVDRCADDRAQVSEQAHGRVRQVWRPERDRPVLVAEVQDAGVRVLGERVAGPEFGAVFGDDLAGGCVLIF